jgi:hypothetical protein
VVERDEVERADEVAVVGRSPRRVGQGGRAPTEGSGGSGRVRKIGRVWRIWRVDAGRPDNEENSRREVKGMISKVTLSMTTRS